MIIQSSSVAMQSSFQRESRRTSETTVRAWRDAPPPPPGARRSHHAQDEDDAVGDVGSLSPRLASLVQLVERMTGDEVRVLDPAELAGHGRGHHHDAATPPARRAGWGVEAVTTETSFEREATAVAIEGSVSTADGRTIDLDVDLALYREVARSTTVRISAGDPAPKDPLALSFGAAPALSTERTDLDLDGDGTTERLPFVGSGLAYLALDRDRNGVVSDGSELFGPASGDGFAELRAHDSDRNGWIDEADPVFTELRLWSAPDAPLQTLAERGVGAIGLANVASPFRMVAGGGAVGELRTTGVWLGENGSVGTVHQFDVLT